MLRLAEGVTRSRIMGRNRLVETIRLSITPTANRNSYRVARLVGVDTQGSVLRPQPWAGKTQLLQSCCCLCKPLPMSSPRGGVHWKPLPMPSPRGGSSFLLCLRWLCGVPSPWGRLGWGLRGAPSPWGRLGWGLRGAPSPWGRLGWGFGWGLWMGLLCQCLGVDVVEHHSTDGEAEDGGDVDH